MKKLTSSQFHQHYTNSFWAVILLTKKIQTQAVCRKSAQTLLYKKTAHKMLVKLNWPVVNLINILRTNLYEHRFCSFFYIHVTREKPPKLRSYEKFVRKMLMKLNWPVVSCNWQPQRRNRIYSRCVLPLRCWRKSSQDSRFPRSRSEKRPEMSKLKFVQIF